eukprot:Gregarina_sp_Poly_1__5120@NODE_270_length_10308_cov_216_811151_g235_i0_p2_GENE_NODE_270_length_10308_cov_216_811151_g235_i0NODE_270_length_10308_cov_216_811151_g235_i0_p2_ORF_typecomplete_len890_score124_78Pkinase_Tyr/PF07714_17/8_1e56Pkinase/PF00069_25/2_9e51Kinaselike/PF14531_6/3e03Kinaselike/PF14531_6/5_7e09Kdo/PF06293_14/2_3e07PIP49_C/PF12260_8/0_0023APH/PF01636_23/0_02WaaY/PF06176_11/0_012_NODE_270_length_10308_cov_216_811151_g235_i0756410233
MLAAFPGREPAEEVLCRSSPRGRVPHPVLRSVPVWNAAPPFSARVGFPSRAADMGRLPRRLGSKSVTPNMLDYAARSHLDTSVRLSADSTSLGHRAQASLSSDLSERRVLEPHWTSSQRHNPVFVSTLFREPGQQMFSRLVSPASQVSPHLVSPNAQTQKRMPQRLRSCAAALRVSGENPAFPVSPSPPPQLASPQQSSFRRPSLSQVSDGTRGVSMLTPAARFTGDLSMNFPKSSLGRLRTSADRSRLLTRNSTDTMWQPNKETRSINYSGDSTGASCGVMSPANFLFPPGLVSALVKTSDAVTLRQVSRLSQLPRAGTPGCGETASLFMESMLKRVQEFRRRQGPVFGATHFVFRRPVNLQRGSSSSGIGDAVSGRDGVSGRDAAPSTGEAAQQRRSEGASFKFWEDVLVKQVSPDGSNAAQIVEALNLKAAKQRRRAARLADGAGTDSLHVPGKESARRQDSRPPPHDESGLEEDDITVASTTARSPRKTNTASPLLHLPETSSSSLRSASTKLFRHQSENYGAKVLYPLSQRLEPLRRAMGHDYLAPGRQTISTSSEVRKKISSDRDGDLRQFFVRASNPVASVILKADGRSDLLCDLPSELKIDVSDIQLQGKAISKGTFGTVFMALWKGKTVAVKWCHANASSSVEQLRNFERELNAYCAIRHERICRFYGACVDSLETLALVTEYLPGGNVFDLLFDNKIPVSSTNRLKMARHLVDVVTHLHSLSPAVIHRDLKTPNLILDNDYNLKLCDFGKTRFMYRSFLMLDDNGGSPRYMAPECFVPNGVISEKADVWSMACCLIEIFGGPIPHEEHYENTSVIQQILTDQKAPMVPYWFCPQIQSILQVCFSWNPIGRPSAREVQEVLRTVTSEDLELHGMNERRTR